MSPPPALQEGVDFISDEILLPVPRILWCELYSSSSTSWALLSGCLVDFAWPVLKSLN